MEKNSDYTQEPKNVAEGDGWRAEPAPAALPPELGSVPLPPWAHWLAQDADGTWWAYEAHPNRHDTGWYENEVGRFRRVGHGAPNEAWESALIRLQP